MIPHLLAYQPPWDREYKAMKAGKPTDVIGECREPVTWGCFTNILLALQNTLKICALQKSYL